MFECAICYALSVLLMVLLWAYPAPSRASKVWRNE